MKKLFTIVTILLISITTAFALPNDTKANQSEVEPRAYIYEGVISAYCSSMDYLIYENYGTYTTSKRVVGYYYMEIPSGSSSDTANYYHLVVRFADGSESRVDLSDNTISYEITETNYFTNKACPYYDGFSK